MTNILILHCYTLIYDVMKNLIFVDKTYFVIFEKNQLLSDGFFIIFSKCWTLMETEAPQDAN